MVTAPRVSIIMNVRNGAGTLREALDSVMSQTFADWEIILWDDCSIDESAAIVAEYTDNRIRYFWSEKETSLGAARDSAIRQAKGEWVAFLDQDDIWTSDKLQKQLSLAGDDTSVGIVYGRTVSFTANGAEKDYDHRHEFQPLPEGDIFTKLFTDSCFISMSSAMLRASALTEIGGIPQEIRVIPDYYLFAAVARKYHARAVQEVVCRYRLHVAGMSHANVHRMHEEALWVVDHWSRDLDSKLVARRREVHNTILAYHEMQRLETISHGGALLLNRGSLRYLLSRPFARGFRALRRKIFTPYFMRS